MKIAIIGGTGFLGQTLTDELLQKGHSVKVLVRPGSESKLARHPGIDIIVGTLQQPDQIYACLEEADVLVYCAGLIREFPQKGVTFDFVHHQAVKTTIEKADQAHVKQYILISANGVKVKGTAYQRSKILGEESLRNSTLDWTIIRPSFIFGPSKGTEDLASRLYRQLVKLPIPVPAFFRGIYFRKAGQFGMSPVYIDDVAKVIVEITEFGDGFSGKTLTLGGPESLTWNQIIQRIAESTGKKKWLFPVPVWLLWPFLILFDRFSWFPITRDQLTMLLEGNEADSTDLFEKLNIKPIRLDKTSLKYLIRA